MRIMLCIYRRHKLPSPGKKAGGCSHADKGRAYSKCSCPIWIDGTQEGKRINYSLKTANWKKACKTLRDIESGDQEHDKKLKPVGAACSEYVSKMVKDGKTEATVKKYRATFLGTFNANRERRTDHYAVPLTSAAEAAGVKFIQNVDLEFLEGWRNSWPDGPSTAGKRIDRLRGFLKWCVAHGWLKSNPAKELAIPKEKPVPTMPYTREEVTALLGACDAGRGHTELVRQNRQRLKALILVARYTGLRISDAVMLTPEKIEGGRVMLYMAKTGTPVVTPLPGFLIEELARTPFRYGNYWFWAGVSTVDATADVWRDRLTRAAAKVGVKDPGWHRFRDTFAVELIEAKVSIDRVSMLLGHASIKITEKHYLPWVKGRQKNMEAEVAAAWRRDPLAIQLGSGKTEEKGQVQ
jgi:integrase/recombinase XerD